MKRTLFSAVISFTLAVLVCGIMILVGYRKFMNVETIEFDPHLEIFLGGGGNSLVLTSEDGSLALVVDTKLASAARFMRKHVKAQNIIVVNTHAHDDHTGGNRLYGGARFISGAYTLDQWKRLAPKQAYPQETVKPGEEMTLQVGSEIVHLRNMGAAHTTNDLVVYLEHRQLLMTGDLVFLNRHPVLSAASGCTVSGWISAIDSLSALYSIKTLLPGHGEVSDKSALPAMKEYFVSIRDARDNPARLKELKKKYSNYSSVPAMADFKKTLAYIKKETK